MAHRVSVISYLGIKGLIDNWLQNYAATNMFICYYCQYLLVLACFTIACKS